MSAKDNDADELLQVVREAIEPIPYWVGYKHARFRESPLPEGAIVAELRESLLARCRPDEGVYCEVAYRALGFRVPSKKTGRPVQADIVLGKRGEGGKLKDPLAVIEVKCGSVLDRRAIKDLAKLRLKRTAEWPNLRRFFVLVTESDYPRDGLSDKGAADRQFAIRGYDSIRVRRVVRAIGHRAQFEDELPVAVSTKKKAQHWAVLYEVE